MINLLQFLRTGPVYHRDHFIYIHFCRAMLCISAAIAVMRCPSVRLSVRLSRSWIMSKRINISSKFFHHREEDIGLSVGAAWIAGQDHSMWRTLRPSAGQAQQWVSEWSGIPTIRIFAFWHQIQDGGSPPSHLGFYGSRDCFFEKPMCDFL